MLVFKNMPTRSRIAADYEVPEFIALPAFVPGTG